MDAPIDQLKKLAATADDVTRQQLVKSLNELVLSLESPNDTVHRYGHMVSCLFAFVELVHVKELTVVRHRTSRQPPSESASTWDSSSSYLKQEARLP